MLNVVFWCVLSGMGYRPQVDKEETLIKFTQGHNSKNFAEHIKHIDAFLQGK